MRIETKNNKEYELKFECGLQPFRYMEDDNAPVIELLGNLKPGAYNPLVVLGQKGSGKSYLFSAYAKEMEFLNPGTKTSVIDCEKLAAGAPLPEDAGGYDILIFDNADSLYGVQEKEKAVSDLISDIFGAGGIAVIIFDRFVPETMEFIGGFVNCSDRGAFIHMVPYGTLCTA